METTMRYGARKGTMNFWRRWLAKAASQELVIFPVPGADLLRMYQSEPLHGDARLSDSPKVVSDTHIRANEKCEKF